MRRELGPTPIGREIRGRRAEQARLGKKRKQRSKVFASHYSIFQWLHQVYMCIYIRSEFSMTFPRPFENKIKKKHRDVYARASNNGS